MRPIGLHLQRLTLPVLFLHALSSWSLAPLIQMLSYKLDDAQRPCKGVRTIPSFDGGKLLQESAKEKVTTLAAPIRKDLSLGSPP